MNTQAACHSEPATSFSPPVAAAIAAPLPESGVMSPVVFSPEFVPTAALFSPMMIPSAAPVVNVPTVHSPSAHSPSVHSPSVHSVHSPSVISPTYPSNSMSCPATLLVATSQHVNPMSSNVREPVPQFFDSRSGTFSFSHDSSAMASSTPSSPSTEETASQKKLPTTSSSESTAVAQLQHYMKQQTSSQGITHPAGGAAPSLIASPQCTIPIGCVSPMPTPLSPLSQPAQTYVDISHQADMYSQMAAIGSVQPAAGSYTLGFGGGTAFIGSPIHSPEIRSHTATMSQAPNVFLSSPPLFAKNTAATLFASAVSPSISSPVVSPTTTPVVVMGVSGESPMSRQAHAHQQSLSHGHMAFLPGDMPETYQLQFNPSSCHFNFEASHSDNSHSAKIRQLAERLCEEAYATSDPTLAQRTVEVLQIALGHLGQYPASDYRRGNAPLLLAMLSHPDEFKNPSSFLKVFGDPACAAKDSRPLPKRGRDGNWECPKCQNVNYPRRFRCNKDGCGAERDRDGDKIVSDYARLVFNNYILQYKKITLDGGGPMPQALLSQNFPANGNGRVYPVSNQLLHNAVPYDNSARYAS